MIEKNVVTDFCAQASEPVIDASSYVHPLAAVIGNVILGKNIMVSPTAVVRGDEGQPLFIGDDSNVQDGVVIHGLETWRRPTKTRGKCENSTQKGPSSCEMIGGHGYKRRVEEMFGGMK